MVIAEATGSPDIGAKVSGPDRPRAPARIVAEMKDGPVAGAVSHCFWLLARRIIRRASRRGFRLR